MEEGFTFTRVMPRPRSQAIDHGNSEKNYMPYEITDGTMRCPYDHTDLTCVGREKAGVTTDAGLYCITCGYLYDLRLEDEYRT